MTCKRFVLFFFQLLSLSSFHSHAQSKNFEYYVPFFGFADNREYRNSVHRPQTIFGARISPEVGYLLDSTHRVRVGVHLMKEFGSEQNKYLHNPILYYQYEKPTVNFKMGFFPRAGLLDQYPLALLNDTLQYYRPNIEGIFLRLKFRHGYQDAFVDWTSRQTATNRETFLIGFSGRQTMKRFFLDHYFLLYHFAGTKTPQPNDHIRDNLGFMLRLGVDLSRKVFFDSLSLHVSWLASFDRLRHVYDWRTPSGFQYGFFLQKKKFFCNAVLYSGDAQDITFGDSFYMSPMFIRADLGYEFIKKEAIRLRFVLSLHYLEKKLDNQQVLTVFIATGNLRKK